MVETATTNVRMSVREKCVGRPSHILLLQTVLRQLTTIVLNLFRLAPLEVIATTASRTKHGLMGMVAWYHTNRGTDGLL
jgi:hypothetical protein